MEGVRNVNETIHGGHYPDPSHLTTAAIQREVNGIHRDLTVLEQGIRDKLANLSATRQRELTAQAELFDARLEGLEASFAFKIQAIDNATILRLESVAKVPDEIDRAIAHSSGLTNVRFDGISQQFEERDIRTEQAGKASTEALAAALQAAKELVGAQGEASAAAAIKSETSFTKQIDQIGTIIQTLEKALDARITELKERIDRGEGSASGVKDKTAQMIAIGAVLVAFIGMVYPGFLS